MLKRSRLSEDFSPGLPAQVCACSGAVAAARPNRAIHTGLRQTRGLNAEPAMRGTPSWEDCRWVARPAAAVQAVFAGCGVRADVPCRGAAPGRRNAGSAGAQLERLVRQRATR